MAETKRRASIVSITLRLRRSDGREEDVKIPTKCDSVFLNAEVAERLLAPYYIARYGLGTALVRLAELHRRRVRSPRDLTVTIHMPYCRYTLLTG
jgi:hypothetical protein